MDLETLISLTTTGVNLYKAVSSLWSDKDSEKLVAKLEQMHGSIETMKGSIERIEEIGTDILYLPGVQTLTDTKKGQQQVLTNLQEVRQLLEPIQRALRQPIASSAMIEIPKLMQDEMQKSPWNVLTGIRPIGLMEAPTDPAYLPFLFEYNRQFYVGWQTRGTLPMSFNLRFHASDKVSPSVELVDLGTVRGTELNVPTKDLLTRGKDWYELGDYEFAIRDLQASLNQNPDLAEAHYVLGKIFIAQGFKERAFANLTHARDLDPMHLYAHYYRAYVNYSLARYADAIKDLERVLKMDPNNSESHYLMGRIHLAQDRPKQAQESFDKASLRFYDDAEFHYYRGRSLIKSDIQKALAAFSHALELKPEYKEVRAEVAYCRGLTLKNVNVEEAISAFTNALRFQTGHEDAEAELTRSYQEYMALVIVSAKP